MATTSVPILSLSTYRKRRRHNPATCIACQMTRKFTPFGWLIVGLGIGLGFALGLLIGVVLGTVAP